MLDFIICLSLFITLIYFIIMSLIMIFLYIALKRALSEIAGGQVTMSFTGFFASMKLCYDVFIQMLHEDLSYALFYVPLFIITEPSMALESFKGPFDKMLSEGELTFYGDFRE